MEKRRLLLAANWKMFPHPGDLKPYKPRKDIDVVVFPTFLDIPTCLKAGLTVGAQYGHPADQGAHTGDIAMKMIKELGCTYVLCGHSERRKNHGETNDFVAAQVLSALKNNLHPILCIGETWEERKALKSKEIVKAQLEAVLKAVQNNPSEGAGLVGPAPAGHHSRKGGLAGGEPGVSLPRIIAYEPVWAISGGDASKPAASAAEAEEMHAFIRTLLTKFRISDFGFRILYGGSMKPENAEELLAQPNIDGGLVGGASLDPAKFQKIVEAARLIKK